MARVALHERAEDRFLLFLGDADPRIGDGEVEHGLVLRLRLALHVRPAPRPGR